ncbi:MAG: TolC family protein [Acidobacteriota bacterium]|nr:TolC family protein [Acidobacteriota bacterium]
MSKTASFWVGLALAASIGAPAGAQQPAASQPDAARVRELVQQALQQAQPQSQSPAAAPAEVFTTAGPRVNLSIEEAVQRGAEKNIDIAVARITPQLTDFTIAGLEASYRLNLTSSTSNQRNTRLPNLTTQGILTPTTSTLTSWSGGIAQNLWKGGGNYALNWTNTRNDSPSLVNLRNPTLQSGLSGSLTQPLMRGFRIDATRAAIRTNRLSQQNDEIGLTATTSSTQASVRNAYWDLVFAIQAVEAAQNSFDLAARLVQDNQSRVEIGTLAPIDIVTAQAEQATRRQALVQAQATVRTNELSLKRLIVSGTDDPLWTSSLNPVDRPPTTPEPINLEAAVTRALATRTDLQQSKNNLQISDINLQNQVDATRPQLNLVANYGLNGIGGTIFQRSGVDPVTGGPSTTTVPSGYLDALRNIVRLDAPVWTVGVNFAYPLGRSAQEATVERSKLSLRQTEANLKALELQIATEVTNAALTVQSSLESVQASAVASELSQKRLEAAQSKMDVGMATNYEVVQAQRDFVEARNNELRATLNYRKALVNFEAVQAVGTRGVGAAITGGGTTAGATGGAGGTTTGGGNTGGGPF